jgi:hypothetical protein
MDTQQPRESDGAFERVPGSPLLGRLSAPIVCDVGEIQGCDELLADLDVSRMLHWFGELLRWMTARRRRVAACWRRFLADLVGTIVLPSVPLPEPPEPIKDRAFVRLQPAHAPPAASAPALSLAGTHA